MNYGLSYREKHNLDERDLTDAQSTLHYIAENMRMEKSISEDGYRYFQQAIEALEPHHCEDAISREAVKEILAKYHLGESRIMEELNELSSVQRTSNAKKHVENTLEDAISRQAVLNILDDMVREYIKENDFDKAQGVAWVKMQKLPSVSTEKKNVEIVKFDTPYTDAISRQAAIDAMREETCGCCWDAKYILKHLPSVSTEKTGRWIPVSERLPEVGVDVLMCDMEGTMYLSHRSSFGSYFDEWGDKIKNIRAWMPLPPCYVPQESEDKWINLAEELIPIMDKEESEVQDADCD